MRRTGASLPVKGQGMSREVQHYIFLQKYSHNRPRSGTTDADMDELIMRLYFARAGKRRRMGRTPLLSRSTISKWLVLRAGIPSSEGEVERRKLDFKKV